MSLVVYICFDIAGSLGLLEGTVTWSAIEVTSAGFVSSLIAGGIPVYTNVVDLKTKPIPYIN